MAKLGTSGVCVLADRRRFHHLLMRILGVGGRCHVLHMCSYLGGPGPSLILLTARLLHHMHEKTARIETALQIHI